MAHVNLLPWRQRQRERRQRIFLAGLGISFLAAVALVALAGFFVGGMFEHQERRNRHLAARIAELDGQLAEIDALRRGRDDLLGRVRALRQLRRGRSATVRLFDELAQTLVPGLHYAELARRGQIVTAKGAAESNDRIAQLMRNLRDSEWFDAPSLKGIGRLGQRPDSAKGESAAAVYGEQAVIFELTFLATSPAGAGGG